MQDLALDVSRWSGSPGFALREAEVAVLVAVPIIGIGGHGEEFPDKPGQAGTRVDISSARSWPWRFALGG